MLKKSLILATGFAAFAVPALSHEYEKDSLRIDHPYTFEVPTTAKTAAGFMTITNSGANDDRLIEVEADFPVSQLHKSEEVDGVMKMMHQEHGILIPAGETVDLAPGGYHVMFMGLENGQLEDVESFPGTLVFENAGEVTVEFKIEERDGSDGHSHHAH
ncbi:copper chaperone PCu(A)C [Qingshengfaniella alkalisoli]|uniref:Copper chaperone PCu(A)C n=1 Tax=Qingshengfaniella alkalisoli TaxID=2599296 RepID=A0A5B8IQG7_9RHOB|nr:copper chaperone PCu(A)C [Qingshengfaniella alkalisoli]QDY68492.1 copper chaperone PCu(A)C [Qingshengfaniella alkalisoli]